MSVTRDNRLKLEQAAKYLYASRGLLETVMTMYYERFPETKKVTQGLLDEYDRLGEQVFALIEALP